MNNSSPKNYISDNSIGADHDEAALLTLDALRELDRGNRQSADAALGKIKDGFLHHLLERELGRRQVKHVLEQALDHPFYRPPSNCQIGGIGRLYEHMFGCRSDGYFVEAGAFNGEDISFTSCLADLGWHGLYVEPIPHYAELCARRHRVNPNVKVVQSAIGSEVGSIEMQIGHLFSSADSEAIERARNSAQFSSFVTEKKVTVPLQPLDDLLAANGAPADFDLLVLDVEGLELEALQGLSLDIWRPKLVIIETNDRHPDAIGSESAFRSSLCRTILEGYYSEIYGDEVNSVYQRQDN